MALRKLKKCLLVALSSALVLSGQQSAQAATAQRIPLVTIHCSCSSITDMKSTALMYYTANFNKTPSNFVAPAGSGTWQVLLPLQGSTDLATKVMVVSDLYPVTGLFKGYYVAPDVPGQGSNKYVVQAITGDSAATIAFDARIMARALSVKPVTMPSTVNIGDDVGVNESLAQMLIPTGQTSFNAWHGITNFPQFQSFTYMDARTGKTTSIYIGDTITVTDINGNTAKFKLVNPASTMPWQYVDGSLKDKNGNPITNTSTPATDTQSQTVVPNAASENWVVNSTGGTENWLLNLSVAFDYMAVLGQIRGEVVIGEIGGGQPGSSSIKVRVNEDGF